MSLTRRALVSREDCCLTECVPNAEGADELRVKVLCDKGFQTDEAGGASGGGFGKVKYVGSMARGLLHSAFAPKSEHASRPYPPPLLSSAAVGEAEGAAEA